VLLHWLVNHPQRKSGLLQAVHIHHGLQVQADDWAVHCQAVCQQWAVPFQCVRVTVNTRDGVEAGARQARYQAFADIMQPGQCLALAHHQDDQAETFLLRALRGSGIDGLAAMRPLRRFAGGQLWRPLLNVPRVALEAYTQTHQLHWIDDPSNTNAAFDRNFLRQQIMPLLSHRWPQAAANFARSAGLAAESASLLTQHDAQALSACQAEDGSVSIASLQQYSPPQQARVLRLWVQQQPLPALPAQGVTHLLHLIAQPLQSDRQPLFRWHGAGIRQWRGQLYAEYERPPWPSGWQCHWDGRQPLILPDGGILALQGTSGFDQALLVRQRQGGERIYLPKRKHSHSLKQCLQEHHIKPWLRDHLPVLCDDNATVLAAGAQIISDHLTQWLIQRHARLHWQAP